LAQVVGERLGYTYFSFDDEVVRGAAEADPAGFVADLPDRTILDEVQRVPELFLSIKSVVDRDRVPGRFLLTGSTNLFLVPQLTDSLAGRMQIQRLHPLAQAELNRQETGFLDALFGGDFNVHSMPRLGGILMDKIIAGGYPAALARPEGRRRTTWYRDYMDAIVQRDVRDFSRIRSLSALPRLLALSASQTAQLLNVTNLASSFQLSRPTIQDYLTLLERVFLIELLPPWHSNRLRRLIKTPKLHLVDTGLASAMLVTSALDLKTDRTLLGSLMETFVFQEIRRQASWHDEAHSFFHYRDKDRAEVDIVIERGVTALAGVEVKAGATVRSADFRGLRKLREATGQKFRAGVVIYDGETCASFGDRLYAVPCRLLWETERADL
jgi:predicted AAA+ superfamily ATPase